MSKFISVQDKIVLITGAAGIIGGTLAQAFLEDGAKVALTDIDAENLAKKEKELATQFDADRFLITAADITREEDIENYVSAVIEKWGRADVLINNAAIDAKFDTGHSADFNQTRFEHFSVETLRKSIEVNIIGTVRMTQSVVRRMLQTGGGSIINLSSTYSLVAPNQALYDFGTGQINYKPIDYVATKSFIPNYTRYLATFYAKDGIRCNTVVPHAVFNNHSEDFLQNFAPLSPLGRMSKREELIGPFILLASDASSYMTGSTLVADGGWTAW